MPPCCLWLARSWLSKTEFGNKPDVRLHCCGANRDGTDGDAGRRQGRRLGTQVVFCSCAVRADRTWCPLHVFGSCLLVGGRAVIGRCRRRHLRSGISDYRRRPHTRHRSLYHRARRHHHSTRNRRCVVDSRCRLHCCTRRLQRRVSYARWNSPRWSCILVVGDA